MDSGDIIGARGGVKRTEKGELSVNAAHVEILTKTLMPLPDKWHGLADIEKRYRQRCPLLTPPFSPAQWLPGHSHVLFQETQAMQKKAPDLRSAGSWSSRKPPGKVL